MCYVSSLGKLLSELFNFIAMACGCLLFFLLVTLLLIEEATLVPIFLQEKKERKKILNLPGPARFL